MTIDYYLLATGLVLLFFPRQWLRAGRKATRKLRWLRRSRSRQKDPTQIREPGDIRLRFGEEFTKPRNYIDFLRALGGGLVILGDKDWAIASCFQRPLDFVLQEGEIDVLLYVRMLILLVAVMIQFIRFEQKFSYYAPIFFLGGLGFAMCGFSAGFFAFVVAWMLNSAAPLTPTGFLSAYALLIFMLGLIFRGLSDNFALFAGIVSFLPVLVSLLARRSLAMFNKKAK